MAKAKARPVTPATPATADQSPSAGCVRRTSDASPRIEKQITIRPMKPMRWAICQRSASAAIAASCSAPLPRASSSGWIRLSTRNRAGPTTKADAVARRRRPASRIRAYTTRREMATIQTVTGPIDAQELGTTLIHEHLRTRDEAAHQQWPGLPVSGGIPEREIEPGGDYDAAVEVASAAVELGVRSICDP